METRVLIIDDHPIFRRGLKETLSDAPDMLVAGEADSGPEALEAVDRNEYDVVLLDLSMDGMNGLEVLAQLKIRHPALPVLILSFHPEEEYAVRCIRSGAAGYLMKHGPPDELLTAIRKVWKGGKYVTPSLAEALAFEVEDPSDACPHENLSQREYEVMCHITRGMRGKDIAEKLQVSPKTVSSYRARILKKMGMNNNAELVRYGMKQGLTD